MVVEVMGHHAGWIALYAGMAGGADVILLPELALTMDQINEVILDRAAVVSLIPSWLWPKGSKHLTKSVLPSM